jgi:hypothetical protein
MDALAAAPEVRNAGEDRPPLLAPPAWLVEEAWILTPPPPHERAHLMRDEAAILLDRLLVRVARGHGALDVAIGEGLAALAVGDRSLRLGYSGIGDYARERLGIAATRTAQGMAQLARELRLRPLLREAVWRGEVSVRKAQAVLPLAAGDAEAEWVARARANTVRALEAAARAGRPARDGEEEEWDRLDIELPPDGRAVVDRALALAGKVLGAAAPKSQRLEAICMEYLGAHPVEPREDEASAGEPVGPSLEALKEGLEAEMQQWRWLDECHAAGPPERCTGGAVEAPVPDSAEEPFVDALRLDEDLRRIAAMRDRWDGLLGHLAMLLQRTWLWRDMKFASFGQYCAERLGMAERTVAQRAALERRLYSLPKLREALRSRRISYEKARLVASVADEASLESWIAEAERSTCVALRRKVEAREEAQMSAQRRFALRVPRNVGVLLAAAFRAVREAEGRWIKPGECLVRVAAHFIETWEGAVPARRSPAKRALSRDGGFCQVPGCSRAAAHAHHIDFRSAGGSDDEWNQTSMCIPHHLHGVHAGYIRVSGRAPDALTWEFGRGYDGAPLEAFEPAAVH